MAAVQVRVTMQNGVGMGLFVKVDNDNLFFGGSGTQILNLSPQTYVATVGGHEPSSSTVTIEFIENGTQLAQQSFTTPTFFGFVPFTVN